MDFIEHTDIMLKQSGEPDCHAKPADFIYLDLRSSWPLQPFVAPFVEDLAPMFVDKLNRAGVVLVLVLLVAFLALYLSFMPSFFATSERTATEW